MSEQKYPVILSFDVGVIHLSYCMMTKKEVNGKLNWHIIDWANIDLAKRDTMNCECGKKASLSNMVDGIMKHYCKVHARKINTEIKPFEEYFKAVQSASKCNNLVKDNECGKKASYNYEDTCLCTTHAKNIYKGMGNASKMKSFKLKDSKKLNFDDVKYDLMMVLESKKNLLQADYVVIENQPSFKNPRMKSIASTLYDYYLIRGIIDKETSKSNITQVKFMSPSNKLKLADDGDTKQLVKVKSEGVVDGKDSKAYKLTKTLGIKYCSEMVSHLPEWLKHFNSHKKKDDLADSFLQGAYFYINNVKEEKELKKDAPKKDIPKKDTVDLTNETTETKVMKPRNKKKVEIEIEV